MSESLISEQIEDLCRQAQEAQDAGDLATAKQLWEALLSMEPENEMGREGLKVCSLADGQWQAFDDGISPGEESTVEQRERIEALLAAGDAEEALRRSESLLESHPQDDLLREIHQKAKCAVRSLAEKQARLAESRAALEQGRIEEARAACRKVLEDEPGDRDAELLLEDIERQADRGAGGSESEASAPVGFDLDLDLDLGQPPRAGQDAGAAGRITQETPIAAVDGDLELDPEFLPSREGIAPVSDAAPTLTAAPTAVATSTAAAPAISTAAPAGDASTSMRDLVEAAADLEEDEPVETFVPPPEPVFEPEEPKEVTGPAAEFLAQAREALANGDSPRAIDLAARALAVDESTPGAQELLDEAHRLGKEREAKAENLLSVGIFDFDQKRFDRAETALREVLELVPGHPEALDYLAKIEEHAAREDTAAASSASDFEGLGGEMLTPIPLRTPQALNESASTAEALTGEVTGGMDSAPPAPPVVDLSSAGPVASVPPAAVPPLPTKPTSTKAERKKTKPRTRRSGRRSSSAMLFVVLVAGAAAAAWYGYQRWVVDDAIEAPAPAPAASLPVTAQKPAAEAQPAHEASGVEDAAQSASVETSAPQRRYDKSEVPGLRRRARQALNDGDPKTAVDLLFAAQSADPSDFDVLDELESAREVLEARRNAEEKIRVAKAAFAEGAYDEAMRIFYRLPEGHQPQGLSRWIGNGWYNLGVRALQAGAVEEAVRFFKNTLEVQADDSEAARHLKVATRYRRRGLDKAYRLYTGNLSLRSLDD